MQNVHFSPPQLAKILEVNVSTIKRWVDKGFLEAQVTRGGHRRITQNHLSRFVQKYPRYRGRSYIINRLSSRKKVEAPDWKKYYHLLHSGDPKAESYLERAYVLNAPVIDILDSIITPALVHIGEQWSKGIISVYEEHKMSFMIRMHLFRLNDLIAKKLQKRPRKVVLACVEKEHHEISLQMIGILFNLHGWQTHILGINIPAMEVIKACQKIQPEIIGLSKVYSEVGSLNYLNSIAKYATKKKISLLYGGTGWSKIIQTRKWRGSKKIRFIPSLRELDALLS